jgi:hypothetical protein
VSIDIELRSGVSTTGEFLPVGVDLGTSAIKIVNPITSEKHRILSIVGDLPSEEPSESVGLKRGAENNIAYESAARRFLLGDTARLHSPNPRWFMYRGFATRQDFEIAVDAVKASVAALTPFKRKREHVKAKLVVGVPATFEASYPKELKKHLLDESPHEFTIRNYTTALRKEVTLHVLDMQIWYQSFGSLYSHCIKRNDGEFSGTVIDVGFGLTNICAFDSLTPIKGGCATIPKAVGDVALHVRENLMRRGGGTDIPGVFALGELLKDRNPVLRTRSLGTVNLAEEVEKASVFVGQDLCREVSFYIDRTAGTEASNQLIITGGGGAENILGKYLTSEYARMNPTLLNDIFANAEGLTLGARDIWQENQ